MLRYAVLSMGEAAGTSPEIILRSVIALSATPGAGLIIAGDRGVFERVASDLSLVLPFTAYAEDLDSLRAAEDAGERLIFLSSSSMDMEAFSYGCPTAETGHASYKALEAAGISYEKTAVGDKYVNENMVRNGHALGGEQSGHIIFSKYATTGDGILTSLMVMEVVMEKKQTLSKLAEEVKIYPQILKNVRVADKKTARENPEVVKAVDAVAKALGDDGRILVRESGTEPVIRVMVEAATDDICEKYVDSVVKVIEAEGLTE